MNQQYAMACDMTALSPPERIRHRQLMADVVASIRRLVELPDGLEFAIDPATGVADVGAWIALETRCCPFLRFNLSVGPPTVVNLSLTGPDGVKEFIAAELGLSGILSSPVFSE